MERKSPKETKEIKEIEKWAQDKKTAAAIFEGMKTYKGWQAGKSVTEAEYDAAVKAFRTAPADGRK